MKVTLVFLLTAFQLTRLCLSEAGDTPGTKGTEGTINNETAATEFLEDYDREMERLYNAVELANWAAKTNISDENDDKVVETKSKMAVFQSDMRQKALQFNETAMSSNVSRILSKIKDIGTAALEDEEKYKELSATIATMESTYGKAKICLNDRCMPMEPDVNRILAKSRDYDQLLDIWIQWRNATGRKIRQHFIKYVELSNLAVGSLGYKDYGEAWRAAYESPTFENDVHELFEQIRPLYQQLHAYVRRKLRQRYGEDKFPTTGHIPAHLLGNMWAQQWNHIENEAVPFPGKSSLDVTHTMHEQGYTVTKMFRTAENFFTSLGMDPMLDTFWSRSMLERPSDGREVVCYASAEDFRNRTDFRIKMCTDINHEDLMTVHHEMGHIEYFMQYSPLPIAFRDGANPGFHEAVGDVMALSVQTPEHLHKLGLLADISNDKESDINMLMGMALQKIAFLPFGYLIDQWRWSVFRGTTSKENYNKDWWDLRCRYQGISPPVTRSEEDFDPGSKYHVTIDVPYIRYFVSFIIQFQFHKAACNLSGHTGPLHRCDIYNSRHAGEKIREMLRMGASQPWPDAMEVLTGQRRMDAAPLLEYFQPLHDFLREQNGDDVGWNAFCPNEKEMRATKRTEGSGGKTSTGKNEKCSDNSGNSGERIRVSIFTLVVALFCLFLIVQN